MKCYVCKRDVGSAWRMLFIEYGPGGEPTGSRFRNVCGECRGSRVVRNKVGDVVGVR